jgi:hypothetical protein
MPDSGPLIVTDAQERELAEMRHQFRTGQFKPRPQPEPETQRRAPPVKYTQVVCLVEDIPHGHIGSGPGSYGLHARAIVMQHRMQPTRLVVDVYADGVASHQYDTFPVRINNQTKWVRLDATAAEFHAACGMPVEVQVTLGSIVPAGRDPSLRENHYPMYRWRVEAGPEHDHFLPREPDGLLWNVTYNISLAEDAWVGSDQSIDVWFPIHRRGATQKSLVPASARITWFPGTPTVNSLVIDADSGTFTLTSDGEEFTVLLYVDLSAATLRAALEDLEAIGAGNCTVSGDGSAENPFLVEYTGDKADVDMPALVGTTDTLTGGAREIHSTLDPGVPGEWRLMPSNNIPDAYPDGSVIMYTWRDGEWRYAFGERPYEVEHFHYTRPKNLDGVWSIIERTGTSPIGGTPPEGTRVMWIWYEDRWNQLQFSVYEQWYNMTDPASTYHSGHDWWISGDIAIVSWTGRAWVVVERERRSGLIFTDAPVPYPIDPEPEPY